MSAAGTDAAAAASGAAETGALVTLHVYDLTEDLAGTNQVLKQMGTGVYHGAVEVYGFEWSFGYCEEETGVFSCEPKTNPCFCYKQSVEMGRTQFTEDEFYDLIENQLMDEWMGETYDLLTKNCCDFSNELCKKLGCGPIPGWVKSAAGVGAVLDDIVHARNLQAVIERGRRVRGGSNGAARDGTDAAEGSGGMGLGDVVSAVVDLGHGVTDIASQETSNVLAEGRRARGAGEDEGYQFGDFCRGMYSGIAKDIAGLVAQGKQARGAEGEESASIGDLPRGAISAMAQR